MKQNEVNLSKYNMFWLVYDYLYSAACILLCYAVGWHFYIFSETLRSSNVNIITSNHCNGRTAQPWFKGVKNSRNYITPQESGHIHNCTIVSIISINIPRYAAMLYKQVYCVARFTIICFEIQCWLPSCDIRFCYQSFSH